MVNPESGRELRRSPTVVGLLREIEKRLDLAEPRVDRSTEHQEPSTRGSATDPVRRDAGSALLTEVSVEEIRGRTRTHSSAVSGPSDGEVDQESSGVRSTSARVW